MNNWVLITRPREEVVPLADALAARGTTLVPYPVLRETTAVDDEGWEQVRHCSSQLSLLFVTSARAPRQLRPQAEARQLWPRLASLPTAAVGVATAAACREVGLIASHVGEQGAVALAETLAGTLHKDDVVLHPTARHHREEAYAILASRGSRVIPLAVYEMIEVEEDRLPLLPGHPPAAVLLTSPRAAAAYLRHAPPHLLSAQHFALGATTARAASQLGLACRALSHPNPLLLLEELCRI